jgi:hypothetical protein
MTVLPEAWFNRVPNVPHLCTNGMDLEHLSGGHNCLFNQVTLRFASDMSYKLGMLIPVLDLAYI